MQWQCACAFKPGGMLSAQWGLTFLCDREIKSGDVQMSWGRTKILLWHLTCNDKLTKRYSENLISEKFLFSLMERNKYQLLLGVTAAFPSCIFSHVKYMTQWSFMSSLNVRITPFYYRSFSPGFSLEDQCYTAQKGFGSVSSAALTQLSFKALSATQWRAWTLLLNSAHSCAKLHPSYSFRRGHAGF